MKKILLLSVLCATIAFGGAKVLPVEKRTFSQSKFIPDISLVLDASYVSRSVEDHELGHLELEGIAHGLYGSHSHGEHAHSSNNANNGFNLNYTELVLSSSVDPFFEMDGVFHFSEESVEIEEAYITSTALDYGLRSRLGKFNSNFGYLNEQHHHYYDFNDMPLVYEGFLGMHGINEKGIQFQYTAPTDFYLMVGVELLNGENEQMFGNSEIHSEVDVNGTDFDFEAEGKDGSTLTVAYAKTAFDIGDTAILTGLSYASGTSHIDHTEDEEAHMFIGDTTLYGFDFVAKHSFDSYSFVKLQTEVLYREMDGTVTKFNDDETDLVTPDMLKKQAGVYAQLIYAPNKTWATGVRYDTIFKNDVNSESLDTDLSKYSAMIEYKTSEFARYRLQYNYNNAFTEHHEGEEEERVKMSSIIFSANISIGAHGAHNF